MITLEDGGQYNIQIVMSNRQKIEKLSSQTSQKLCAAQVIPDLPSVIKELIDNSIDAKCTVIKIQLHDYGKKRIEVTDNGCGISYENLKKIAQQGATSKLNDFESIDKVVSLGFRGQALCSIASISKMQIESMHQKDKIGHIINVNQQSIKEIDTHYGTKVTIEDPYYTLPARRAHIQTQGTNIINQIVQLIKQYSIIYVSIQFVLQNFHDGKNDSYFDSGYGKHFEQKSWKERIAVVLGSKVADGLVYIQSEAFEGWVMERVLSGSMKPEEWLKKKILYLYCNRRPINFLPSLGNILDEVYKEYNSSSKYICILNIKFKEKQFDINVSPDKRQIYWVNEDLSLKLFKAQLQKITEKSRNEVKNLSAFIERKSIKKSFMKQEKQPELNIIRPKASTTLKQRLSKAMGSKPEIEQTSLANNSQQKNNRNDCQLKQNNSRNQIMKDELENIKPKKSYTVNIKSANIDKKDFSRMKILGQFNCGFIVCQLNNNFFLVDQHSADEKCNYEKILNSKCTYFVTNTIVPLSPDQHDKLIQSKRMQNFGYKYHDFSDQQGKYYVALSQMPVCFGQTLKEDFFMETLESDIQSFIKHPQFQKKAATYACRKSIMIGDPLRKTEMQKVVKNLSDLQSPWNCPHGRPTSIFLNSLSYFVDNVKFEEQYNL